MSKLTAFFISLVITIIGAIVFIISLINLNGSGITFGAIMGFGGLICTIVIKTLIESSAKKNPQNNNTPQQIDIKEKPHNVNTEAKSKEYKSISWNDLSFEQVIDKYLTTNHASSPSEYKYIEYHYAEFDCILNNLKKVNIELLDEKILRNQAILTPFEKSKNITASTKISKIKDFIAVDVETTGLKTGYNDIIEISAIKFVNFEPQEIFTTLLKPRKHIPEDATAINGITDEMVKDSPTFAQIHNSLKEFLGNSNLVMHNAAFDVKFLFVSGLEFAEKQNIYCTLELSKRFLKNSDGTPYDTYKLSDVCAEECIFFNGAHRSAADALATGLLFNEIVKNKKEIENLKEAALYQA